jgi:hypothetical protein
MKTVRIATSNNFNFTKKEIEDYYKVKKQFPNTFVNSHIKTNIKDPNIPVIVTLNPNINDMQEIRGYKDNIKALRVKFVYSKTGLKSFINCVKYAKQENIPMLITFFRSKRNTQLNYFGMSRKYYKRIKNFHRLTKQSKNQAIKIIEKICNKYDAMHLLNYCDKLDKGCSNCKNCSKLTFNNSNDIYEINLQSSGMCPYNCVACFAKYTIIKNTKTGLKCNVIKQNAKQGKNSAYIKIDGLKENNIFITENEINKFKTIQDKF